MGKFAYATLVMRGDKYIPGALVMGYSLKQVSSPDIDVVVMITKDISKKCRNLLTKIFDHVIDVPYIKVKSTYPIVKTEAQRDRYNVWLADSYTKWNVLSLSQYEKVFLLDADVIAIKNIDDVFDFETPAGVFDTPFSSSFGKGGFYDFYKNIKFGEKVPLENIHEGLNNEGHVAWGTAVLVSPSKKDYKDFIKMLKDNQPFGFNTHSGNDEQSIAYFYYLKKIKWTNLPNNLNTIAWYQKMIQKSWKIPDFCKESSSYAQGGRRKRKSPKRKSPKRKKRRVKKAFMFSVGSTSPFLKGGSTSQRERKTTTLDKCQLINSQVPHIIHYFGSEMVWDYKDPNIWPDTPIWWQYAYNLACLPNKKLKSADIKTLKKMFRIKHPEVKKICFWCKFLGKDFDHHVIDKNNILVCPLIKN